ncbi:hypothetical protein ABZ491_01830 [Micromonospora rifamycinica]|uniref:hypothetical protein n=1 Tax=Micromonospora rifamycinica TaxID=291594 RepID=UPI0033F2CDC0
MNDQPTRDQDVCATCHGVIEWVNEDSHPYWRHVDSRNLNRPHGARPAPQTRR